MFKGTTKIELFLLIAIFTSIIILPCMVYTYYSDKAIDKIIFSGDRIWKVFY